MFERFTDRARQTVVLAQEEARLLGHGYIGTEHLLLGLLHEGDGVARRGAAPARHRPGERPRRRRGADRSGRGQPRGHIPFTPRAKKVLELSLREALQLGHNYIGTEHILLGLVREGEGVAAQVLGRRGAAEIQVRAVVVDELRRLGASGESGRPPQRAREPGRTPGAEAAVAAAHELAASAPVGSQHLLEALARSEDSLAGKVLAVARCRRRRHRGQDRRARRRRHHRHHARAGRRPPDGGAPRRRRGPPRPPGRDVGAADPHASPRPSAGPVRGDDAAVGSLVGPVAGDRARQLEDVRRRVAPLPDEAETGPRRSALVRQAIENRLARRRR